MKKIRVLKLAFLLLIQTMWGVVLASDTICIKNPVYYSEFEQTVFNNYLKTRKADVLKLALCLDTTISEQKVHEYHQSMKDYSTACTAGIAKISNNKKKIQYITKTLNHRLFIKYNSNTLLTDLFVDGDFNCVTGSLFYSLVLDSLNIPYVIKEEPTHVFLLAYPSTFSVPLESTDPAMMIFVPNEDFKNNYNNFLLDSKIITKSELAEKGAETIFNNHYYSDKDISSVQLVGLLYYNKAVEYYEAKKFNNAFEYLEKAYLLYPCERVRYLLISSLILTLDNVQNTNTGLGVAEMPLLAKLISYSNTNQYNSLVESIFNDLTNKYLRKQNKEDAYDEVYLHLINQLTDSTLISKITTEYYYEKSRAAKTKGNIDKGWEYITKAYRLNPVDLDIRSVLQWIFSEKMQALIGTENYIVEFRNCLKSFPVLAEDLQVLRIGCLYYVENAVNAFNNDELKTGSKMLAEFDSMVSEFNYKPEATLVGEIYGAAASYYYRKKNIKMCKSVLEKGLELSPGNEKLIRKYKLNITHEIQ